MKAIGILPARWASTRLPGKVLVEIAGTCMLEHVWRRVKQAKELSDVIIACDEPHVLARAKGFGANAVLTRKDHPSGSDRVAEAAMSSDADIIVNIQADEPLIQPGLIDALVQALKADVSCVLATPIKRLTSVEEFRNPNVVKVVVDKNACALYFSRAPIPYKRDGEPLVSNYFKHLGIYAYRRDFLFEYCRWAKSFLEQEESLEQLRVLEAGYKIKTVETTMETIGVDTPEDVLKVEAYMKAHGIK
ncbi:MAG: 3-deoxy-manno-octulosonate cytidylyltransferase [Candidatus Omnitrophica bacterium]|nr:3-deoxy-manno-octulosonate cytidylyltransferase [Candidatus Omnitrophota bacterium]